MRTLFSGLVFFCAATMSIAAEVSPVRLRVEQVTSNDSDRHKHAQRFSLKLFLSNSSSADVNGLNIKYVYFGKDVDTQDVSVVERGERRASIAALGNAVIETEPAKANYTEEHGERAGKAGRAGSAGNRRKAQVRFKTVEAKGTKINGYGVQVFSGGKLVAEAYSAPSLQERMK